MMCWQREKTRNIIISILFSLLILFQRLAFPQEVESDVDVLPIVDSIESRLHTTFDPKAIQILEEIYSETNRNKDYIRRLSSFPFEISQTDFVKEGIENYIAVLKITFPNLRRVTENDMKRFRDQVALTDLTRTAPQFGFVTIYTEPDGAHIFINNRDENRITPVEKLSYRTGNHLLTLHKGTPYKDTTDIISINRNQETKLHYKLVKQGR